MNAIRPDGAELLQEFGLDPSSRMVRRKRATRPHEQWRDSGWINGGHYEAADKYVRCYERGLLGADTRYDDEARVAPAERFHEVRSHHLHLLMRAQEALRSHERQVLDCTLLAGMTLDAYALEWLRLASTKPDRIGVTKGLVLGGLASLCEHWRIAC